MTYAWRHRVLVLSLFWLLTLGAGAAAVRTLPLGESNQILLAEIERGLGLSAAQADDVRALFSRSSRLGQGNPAVTLHPMTPEECRERRSAAPEHAEEGEFPAICGAPFMAPLYAPSRQSAGQATACIDQYEFPGLPCVYPVVWARAREAAELCAVVGKRLCDAHEWEGACAGSLEAPDYRFDLARGVSAGAAVARLRAATNRAQEAKKVWSYGPAYRRGVCGTSGAKTQGCNGGDWQGCGSNTFPSGSFPACRSPLGVYDLHGNAAEHMNLPLAESEMASRDSTTLGVTEMKGSWFVFDRIRAHEDACRWRAPYWHGSRVKDPKSHQNYHLGFRCCKTLAAAP